MIDIDENFVEVTALGEDLAINVIKLIIILLLICYCIKYEKPCNFSNYLECG